MAECPVLAPILARFPNTLPEDFVYVDVTYENKFDGDLEASEEELENILIEVDARTPQEIDAMREYVESRKRSKFLFDGQNLIKIKPKKLNALKAILGKALLVRKRRMHKRITSDPSKFEGTLQDYLQPSFIVPVLIDRITGALEQRTNYKEGVYAYKADEEEVRRLKALYKRGKDPEVK